MRLSEEPRPKGLLERLGEVTRQNIFLRVFLNVGKVAAASALVASCEYIPQILVPCPVELTDERLQEEKDQGLKEYTTLVDPGTGEVYLRNYHYKNKKLGIDQKGTCPLRTSDKGDFDKTGGDKDQVDSGDSMTGDDAPGGDSFVGDSFVGDSYEGDTEIFIPPDAPALSATGPMAVCNGETYTITGSAPDPTDTQSIQYKEEGASETEWQAVTNYNSTDGTFSVDVPPGASYVFRLIDNADHASNPTTPFVVNVDLIPPPDPTVPSPIGTCITDSDFTMDITNIDPESKELAVEKEGTEIVRETVLPGETEKSYTFPNDGVEPTPFYEVFASTAYGVRVKDGCGNESAPLSLEVNKYNAIETNWSIVILFNPETPDKVVAGGYAYRLLTANIYGESFDVGIEVIDPATGGDPGSITALRFDIMGATDRNAIATLTTPPPVAGNDHIDVRATFHIYNSGGSNCSSSISTDFVIWNTYP